MTPLDEVAAGPSAAGDRAPEPELCAVCGVPLDPDQEWCLECGTGRTIIERPPDWRIPVVVVGAIIVLAIAGLAVALATLASGDPLRKALTPSATPPTAPRGTASAPKRLAGWPVGLDGWTVVLAAAPTRMAAVAAADRLATEHLAARALLSDLGVLDTGQHPAIRVSSDPWRVFDGRYPSQSAAQTAAAALSRNGQSGLNVVEVAAPGGI